MGRRLNSGLIEQLLKLLGEAPLSAVELSPLVDRSVNQVGSVLSAALSRGLVVRLWRAPPGFTGGKRPWVFGLPGVNYRRPDRQTRGPAKTHVFVERREKPISRGPEHVAPPCRIGRGFRWGASYF